MTARHLLIAPLALLCACGPPTVRTESPPAAAPGFTITFSVDQDLQCEAFAWDLVARQVSAQTFELHFAHADAAVGKSLWFACHHDRTGERFEASVRVGFCAEACKDPSAASARSMCGAGWLRAEAHVAYNGRFLALESYQCLTPGGRGLRVFQ